MDKKMIMHPVAIAGYIGSILLVISSRMSWITLPDNSLANLVAKDVMDMVASKQSIVMVLGFFTLVLGFLAATKTSRGVAIVNVVLGVFLLLPITSSYLSADDPAAKLIELEGMDTGYTIAVLGWLIMTVASVAAVVVYKKGAAETKTA